MAIARTFIAALVAAIGLLFATVLLLLAVIPALPFLATALITKLSAGRNKSPDDLSWHRFVEYEPEIGWRPRANMDVYGHADEVFRLTTGPDGWRGSVSVSDADVVVFGDSFAFGHGAEDDKIYTNFCGDVSVKPIGSDGYSMVHALLWMRRLAPEIAGKLVLWFVYCGNDLHESVYPNMGRYRMPFVRENGDDWEIATDHVSPEPWSFTSSHDYHRWLGELCCSTPTSDRVFSAVDYLIRQGHEISADAGARLVVVSVPMRVQLTRRGEAHLRALAPQPDDFKVDRPDWKLHESCQRLGVPFVPLKRHLSPRHYLLKDIHWTREGHRRVGSVVKALYEDFLPGTEIRAQQAER